MSARSALGKLFFCAPWLTCAGCGSAGDTPPNVVVLMLDTARPDYLSVYGHPWPTTPFLDTFAAEGTRFDRAYSVSCWTLPAHGSLFTGTPPEVHRADEEFQHVADSLPLLAERLGERGYRTAGFSANAWVGPETGLDRGFDRFEDLARGFFRPHVTRLARDRAGRRTPPEQHYVAARVLRWLSDEGRGERPFFLFVNLVDAHTPYLPHDKSAQRFLPAGETRWGAIQRFFPDGESKRLKVRHYANEDPLSAADWEALRGMYAGELRVVDELCETLVTAVDAVSPPENTLIFILSDHGENLGDHGHFTHIFNLYDSNLRIALLARGPGFAPAATDDRLVQISDLYPTILRAAGLVPADHVEARDLLGPLSEPRVLRAAAGYPHVTLERGFPEELVASGRLDAYRRELDAVIGPRYKLIRSSDGSEEIYDLRADPDELHPLAPATVDAEALTHLRQALARTYEAAPGASRGDVLSDEERLRDLKAMGYVDD